MSSDEQIVSFLFYTFLVYPINNWIMAPGRFPQRKAVLYSIGFLGALAALKTWYEISNREPNYYEFLQVKRSDNTLAIKRAYKSMSIQLHPDKNRHLEASVANQNFARLKEAYDVLMDSEAREVYNKFGADGLKSKKTLDETHILLELAIFYITWGMMVFFLTLGKASAEARNWVYTGQICMLIIEVSMLTSNDFKLPEWLFPYTTEFEFIALMHTLFPAFMNGCRSIGGHLYVDMEKKTKETLLQLIESNKNFNAQLRELNLKLRDLSNNIKHRPGKVETNPKGKGSKTDETNGTGVEEHSSSSGLMDAMDELSFRVETHNEKMKNKLVEELKPEKSKTNYSALFMIVAYICFNIAWNSFATTEVSSK